VRMGDKIMQQQADQMLLHEIRESFCAWCV